jgi:hypothetical protein
MAQTQTQQACVVKHNYGTYGDMKWLYAYYDLETQTFVIPRIYHEKNGGDLYFNLRHGKQYILFYYYRRSYIVTDREIEAMLVEIDCNSIDDRIKELGKMRIEFSSFEWLHEQRRKWIIPQQVMKFLEFLPYYAKPPEFDSIELSKDEQERLLQMIRLGVVLKEH